MIYLCLPSHNNAATIGLLLWKIRTVFDEFPRQYQLLVADDGSTDDTLRVLKPYEKSLPLTVLKSKTYRGYAATIEDLLREAIKASDRPKRDCVITLYPDFTASPSCIPDMIRRFESGADVVIAQVETDRSSMLEQAVRKLSPALMRPGVRIPGLSDLTSGICAIRLITLRRCFRDSEVHMLQTDGPSAHAELIARAASIARQITVVSADRGPGDGANQRIGRVSTALNLFLAGKKLRIPAPETEIELV